MKNIILILSIASIALSSCSSKLTVVKRKYTKGFYVSTGHKSNTPKSIHEPINSGSSIIDEKETVMVSPSKNNEEINTSPELSIVHVNTSEQKNNFVTKTVTNYQNTTASIENKTVIETHMFKSLNKSAINHSAKAKKGGDDNLVLLVILSLFPILALIAIYLKDGKSITMNFWVDLLLHFIALWWLFALLVVLDVFSLA